jgi:hypothetical protein
MENEPIVGAVIRYSGIVQGVGVPENTAKTVKNAAGKL